AGELADAGKEVVLSSLALIEAESELAVLQRQVDRGRFWLEANDLSAVQLCRVAGLPFVAGPSLAVYNHRALAMLLEDGLRRGAAVPRGRPALGGRALAGGVQRRRIGDAGRGRPARLGARRGAGPAAAGGAARGHACRRPADAGAGGDRLGPPAAVVFGALLH